MIIGIGKFQRNFMAKYGKAVQKNVASAMKRMEKGTLRNGGSGKKVTNPKQAIAIGLSEAREKGAKVPQKKAASKKSVAKKTAPKKTASKSLGVKKSAPVKLTGSKQAVATKKTTKRKAAPKKKPVSSKAKKQSLTDESLPVMDKNFPPVEEKSADLIPGVQDRTVDPIVVTDKKELAKALTKHDPAHTMRLSGAKSTRRPAGKKPLWR